MVSVVAHNLKLVVTVVAVAQFIDIVSCFRVCRGIGTNYVFRSREDVKYFIVGVKRQHSAIVGYNIPQRGLLSEFATDPLMVAGYFDRTIVAESKQHHITGFVGVSEILHGPQTSIGSKRRFGISLALLQTLGSGSLKHQVFSVVARGQRKRYNGKKYE